MLDCSFYPYFEFYKVDEELEQSVYTLFHMNWGEYGSQDGYFFDSNLQIKLPDGKYYRYNFYRKDLYISK